jgi:hypothetical protein
MKIKREKPKKIKLRKISLFGSEVSTAVIMNTRLPVLWDRTPCNLVKFAKVSVECTTPILSADKSKMPVRIKQNSYRILGYRRGGYGYVECKAV